MGIWVFPVTLFLLCLTSESLQGGLPRLPPNLGKGYSLSSGLGTAFGGDAKPQKSGAGGGMEPPKPGTTEGMKPPMPGFSNGDGAFPGVGTQPGLGVGMKPQQPGFGNGNTLGAQPDLVLSPMDTMELKFKGMVAYTCNLCAQGPRQENQEFQSGPAVQNGFGAGFEGVGKAQKPGLGNRNGQGAGTFPGTGAQGPGLGGGLRPQKPGYEDVKPQKPGFGNGNGFGLGSQPGPSAQNGHGPGITEGMKPPKPGFSNGDGAFPGVGAQTGLAAQNRIEAGLGEGRKTQKPGYGNGNGNGLDALPDVGVGGKPQKPGYGLDSKAQKPGLWNVHGLGVQLGYNNGNGMAAQPGPCNGGISPAQLLPRPPTPVPSDTGGGWGLKSQLPAPVQNGKFPAPTPAIQWGLKPQKAGYQPFGVYRAGAELGFRGGLKLQKVGFPIANGFRNGELDLGYQKQQGRGWAIVSSQIGITN
uniref:glycine-rich extracellular protein 1 n=1 Tax=Arvicanthis niloticus TaxID=61156 RepID=UPI00402B2050